jgi:hypothetical protein
MATEYMKSGMLWGAGLLQTALADAVIHLFKGGMGIIISDNLQLADLEAAEADFTGYAPITVATWLAPYLMPGGGAGTSTGSKVFAIASPYTVGNSIGGGWIQDADDVLVFAWDYSPAISLVGPGDAVPVEQIVVFG